MNFTEWLESLEEPLYEVNDRPACPPGYKWSKKAMSCVPRTPKDDVSNKRNKDSHPGNMSGFNVIGATGMNGDGYAYGEATKNPVAAPMDESRYDRYDEQEKEFKKKDKEMKYGKDQRKSSLRPGEVRKPNSRGGYDSNYDK